MFGRKKQLNDLVSRVNEKETLLEELEKQNQELKLALAEEQKRVSIVEKMLPRKKEELEKIESLILEKMSEYAKLITTCRNEHEDLMQTCINEHNKILAEQQRELEDIKDRIVKNANIHNIQSYGFYEPLFKEGTSEDIKGLINENRELQKNMLRHERYYSCDVNWTVNGSRFKGNAHVKKIAKNYITSFNLMCDAIIERVTVANMMKTKNKIIKTFETLNDHALTFGIDFNFDYLELKIQELELMYSVTVKKEEEKEERILQAQIIKEQKKVEQELKIQREKLEKELRHYQIQLSTGDSAVQTKIDAIKQQIADNDYRRENALAGYVYVIENKAFGEGIYKIGVTRRLEPLERISELSNASVPFKFEVNCIVFSENAYALENTLHKEFADRRVNKANRRKEYFKVPLAEIEHTFKEKFNIEAEFNYAPIHNDWLVSDDAMMMVGIDADDDED